MNEKLLTDIAIGVFYFLLIFGSPLVLMWAYSRWGKAGFEKCCLALLVTVPVFWALFDILRESLYRSLGTHQIADTAFFGCLFGLLAVACVMAFWGGLAAIWHSLYPHSFSGFIHFRFRKVSEQEEDYDELPNAQPPTTEAESK